jgi:hypothetical protein
MLFFLPHSAPGPKNCTHLEIQAFTVHPAPIFFIYDQSKIKTMTNENAAPKVVDRGTFQQELDTLRVREKAHTREGDAIAAARRRLPMVEVDAATRLIGKNGPVTLLDTFEGRRMLIAYYFMWHTGHPAPNRIWAAGRLGGFAGRVAESGQFHAHLWPGYAEQ